MNRRCTYPAVILFLAAFAMHALTQAAPKRQEAKLGDFELTLSADKEEYRVGEPPTFSAILTNRSGKDALLVPALDGSGRGGRYPVVKYEIVRPENAPPPKMFGICGNTNNIVTGDFVTVADGGMFNPASAWVGPAKQIFNAPGTYIITLTYDTGGDAENWYGFGGELENKKEIDRQLARIPIIKLTSNVVKLTFTGEALKPKVPIPN